MLVDLLRILQQLAQAVNSTDVQDILDDEFTVIEPETEDLDGGRRRIGTGITGERDLTIEIGDWKLRLVPVRADGTGDWELAIDVIQGPDTGGGDRDVEELRIHLARFELEAAPDALIPADLRTEPHTHLVRSNGGTVKLLGPGFTLILRGNDLSEIDFDFSGATGGSDDDFPSARFEPPHFIVGGTGDELGVVCDEVLLDLDRTDNPAVVDERLPDVEPAWRGFHLKELGVFIGDGSEVGTWSGMAAMKDFFIGLDELDLTGTFMAELVHYALPDAPQVQVSIFEATSGGGESLVEDEGDAAISGPEDGRDYRRVRLEARPNWDSAGFRPRWTVPAGVLVEEPGRINHLNLGWVRLPSGTHTFEVEVRDHRVPTQTESRDVVVDEAAPGAGGGHLTAVLEGIIDLDEFGPGQRPTNRIHTGLTPGQRVVLRASVAGPAAGGASATAACTLTLPAGFSLAAGAATQNASRGGGTRVFETVEWTVEAPGSIVAPVHEAFELEVTVGSDTIRRRLRVSVEEALPSDRAGFELWSYSDWRADPGIGLARVVRRGGLAHADITWTLESAAADPDLFSDAARDALFDPSGGGWEAPVPMDLADSAGTVRPFLEEDGRVWRLTGTVGGGGAAGPTTYRAVGAAATSRAVSDQAVLMAGGPTTVEQEGDPSVGVGFQYDDDHLLPSTAGVSNQRDRSDAPLENAEVDDLQVAGMAALQRAILAHADRLGELRLVGMASFEGDVDYNHDLGQRRADAVRAFLENPGGNTQLRDRIAALPDGPSAAEQSTVATVLGGLTVEAISVGERHGAGRLVPDADPDEDPTFDIDPGDRRVFAVLELAGLPTTAVVRREYFVTLPDAPPPSETPPVPERRLQDHPFEHSWFRSVHVEVEVLRNELIRLQLKLKVDLEAFNENDTGAALEERDLNRYDGETTFFLEMKRDPDPEPDEPEFTWELVALADPKDLDGFAMLSAPGDEGVLGVLGGPSITVPVYTALDGGETGLAGFGAAAMLGVVLSATGAVDVRTLVWRGIRLGLEHGNVQAPTISLGVDYTTKYNIDLDLGVVALQTDDPIEIGFRNVGVKIEDLDTVTFFYDPSEGFHLEVDDPGVFTLGGGLGQLIGVNALRSGAGSPFFIEVEFGLKLETGVFELDTFGIRASIDADALIPGPGEEPKELGDFSFSDFTFQITKIGVTVSVPGVLTGRGEVGIREDADSTTIEGEVDVKLEPLDLTIAAAAKIVQFDDYTSVFGAVAVQFAPGIPLGTTGVAIQGFSGLVGAHMKADHGGKPLPWWKKDPVGAIATDKWTPERGNWAFGVGAVLGTVYDTGFTFHMQGMLIVEVPGPRLLLGTTGRFLQVTPDLETAMSGGIICVIMLDFENDIFLIGLEFTLEIPKLLKLRVPVEIFFNLARANDWHIYFGQWEPREKRIEIDVLGIFKAWGYVMIAGDSLAIPGMELAGPAFAMGGRIEIFWGSRSAGIYLEAYIEVHVGLQFRPAFMRGLLRVGGELHLGPICIGASGELEVLAPDPWIVRGKICGKLKLFFFTIKGCAKFTIGDGEAALPDPADPWTGIAMVDRMTSMAIAPLDPSESPAPEVHLGAVPLDAVVHVLFDQDMWDRRTDPVVDIVSDQKRTQVSEELHYEFNVDAARVVATGGGIPVPVEMSAWAPYTVRAEGDPDAAAESAASARTLRLLSWEPSAHTRAVDFTRGYQDTLKALFERLCDPTLPPQRVCTDFDEEALGPAGYWILTEEPLTPVRVISLMGGGLGDGFIADVASVIPSRVVQRPPFDWPGRHASARALRLGSSPRAQKVGSLTAIFPNTPVHDPNAGGGGAGVDFPTLEIDPDLTHRLRRFRHADLREAPVRLDETIAEHGLQELMTLSRSLVEPEVEDFDGSAVPSLDARITRNPFLAGDGGTPNIGGRTPDIGGRIPDVRDRMPEMRGGILTSGVVLPRVDLDLLRRTRGPLERLIRGRTDTTSARTLLRRRFEGLADATPEILDRSRLAARPVEGGVFDASGSTAPPETGSGTGGGRTSEATTGSTAYRPNPATALWQSGALLIRVPDAVAVDLTFVLPDATAGRGEVVFLGRNFQPVSPIHRLSDLPQVPGSSGPASGVWQHHDVRRASFSNPEAVDTPKVAAWIMLLPPGNVRTKGEDPHSYLVDICAVRFADWQAWRDRERTRHDTIAELERLAGLVGADPAVASQPLLDPGTEYEVEVDRSWTRYESDTAVDHSGEGAWTGAPDGVTATFRTAAEAPKSIRRYIAGQSPPAADQPHYYEEPVRIVFGSDVVDRIYEKFGQQLVVRAKADTGRHVVAEPVSDGREDAFFPMGSFEEELFRFLTESDDLCMSADWEHLFPKSLVTLTQPLEQNRGYTVTLIPRPIGEPAGIDFEDWDRTLQTDFDEGRDVFRWDLKTSRWPTFDAHVEAYRSAPAGDLIGGPDTELDAALGALPGDRGDESVEAVTGALFGGPVKIPAAPEVARLWTTTGAPAGPFEAPPMRCRGVLLDGPEPLLRRRADGAERTSLQVRAIPAVGAPEGAETVPAGLRIVVSARGARLLLLFDTPTPPAALRIRLKDQAEAGGTSTLESFDLDIGSEPASFQEDV